MKRRAFLKVLGLSALAPKVAVELLSTESKGLVVGRWYKATAIYGSGKVTFDPVKYGVIPLRGRGVSGDNTLTGDEEVLTFIERR